MFTPAELKFVHYDYFRNHDFLGLQGVLPVAMLLKPNPFYLKIVYPFDIGRIYFNAPEMSADTGTFIEGFSRFGDLGTIAIFLLIALYLRLMDSMQDRTDYRYWIFYLSNLFFSRRTTYGFSFWGMLVLDTLYSIVL